MILKNWRVKQFLCSVYENISVEYPQTPVSSIFAKGLSLLIFQIL